MSLKLKHVLVSLALFAELSPGISKELEGNSTIRDLVSNQVRSYVEFTQLGEMVEGEVTCEDKFWGLAELFGFAIDMNSDGSRVVAGAPSGRWCRSSYVDVFKLEFTGDGSPQWVPLGNRIARTDEGGLKWGHSVGINGAGTRVVVGTGKEDLWYQTGLAMRVFDLDETTEPPTWKQVGEGVFTSPLIRAGAVVAISKEGGHVAFQGDVYAHNETTDTWEEVGTGLENCDVNGFSANGKRVNCGVLGLGEAHNEAGILEDVGTELRSVYELDEASKQWNQVGSDTFDGSQFTVLNENGNTLAVLSSNGKEVQVYQLDDNLSWKKVGNDMTVKGWDVKKVSINSDGNRIAIGVTRKKKKIGHSKVDIFDYNVNKREWKRFATSLKQESGKNDGDSVSLSSNGLRLAIGGNAGIFRTYEVQKHTISQIKSSYDFDGRNKTWCMLPEKVKQYALAKVKPCKGNQDDQRWFHDTNNQIRTRLKPSLCLKLRNRAVRLGSCTSSGKNSKKTVHFFYDGDMKQIYTKKKNKEFLYLGIDVKNKSIRAYKSQSKNPSLSLWSIDPL